MERSVGERKHVLNDDGERHMYTCEEGTSSWTVCCMAIEMEGCLAMEGGE